MITLCLTRSLFGGPLFRSAFLVLITWNADKFFLLDVDQGLILPRHFGGSTMYEK
jgi:hypothetical protein